MTLQTLGSYELQAEIGQGGMATVYRARQGHTGRQVAVKVLRKSIVEDEGSLERFRREARLIARLDHPHILPIYDFDGTHHPPYLVMRYVEGGTLEDVLARRMLSLAEVQRLLEQIALALDYAHRQGVVHRDIKPSNIMLDAEGNAFVTDFGIARMSGEPAAGTSITQDGVVIGTPDYISPEQALGQAELDGRADLYSLGVILFEMLSGRLPFVGDSPMLVMIKHLQDVPPSLHALNPRLPAGIDGVVARALAKDPAERFSTAGDLAAAFVTAMGEDSGAATTPVFGLGRPVTMGGNGGAPASQTPVPENKVVTALWADAAEYRTLMEKRSDAETAEVSLSQLWQQAERIAVDYQGQILARAGTGLLMLWGAGSTHEGDPEQALRAALDLQTALRNEVNSPQLLPLRIGVHTGLALLTPNETEDGLTASGAAIELSERLCEGAEGNILISQDTYREVRGAFDILQGEPLRLRGRKEKIDTFVVIALKNRLIPLNARGIEGIETRLIGREPELKRLQDAYLNAAEDSETQALTVVADAGLGKSRLLYEFEKWMDLRPEPVWFFRVRATANLSHRPYALVRDVLAFRFEIHENDPAEVMRAKLEIGVAELLGDDEKASLEMAHFIGHLAGFEFSQSPYLAGLINDPKQIAARARQMFIRFIATVAGQAPLVIHIDDLHHADEASLDLFEALINAQPNLRLLFVGLARPALLEHRPTWAATGTLHQRLGLGPLSKRDSRDLAREILQKVSEPPKALRDLLVERAEGNPLFMEELVKMLIEDRVIVKDSPDVWRVEESRLANLRVPPTLKGLLQARFDTLLYPEKLTLQRAAVAGRAFQDAALVALDKADGPRLHIQNLGEILTTLTEREFIYRRPVSSVSGSAEYAFTQTMLRDLIYETLLTGQCQTYHAAMANWLAASERVEERWPIIAQHYEIAGEWQQAALCFERAGDKAMQVSAFAEALKFYSRALSPQRPEVDADATLAERLPFVRLSLKQAEAYNRLTEFEAALSAVKLVLNSTQVGSQLAHALAIMGEINTATGDYAGANTALTAALPLARNGADPAVLARVLYALGDVQWRLGELQAAETYLNESIWLSREHHDTLRTLFALNRLGTVMGSLGRNEAESQLYEEVRALAQETGNRDRLMTALNNLGTVAQERGDLATAQAYYRQALEIAQEIGVQDSIILYMGNIAYADAKLGNREAARSVGREALRRAVELGTLPWVVMGLLTFIELAHAEGDDTRALALMGVAEKHPAFSQDNRRLWDATLKAWALEPGKVEAGLAVGAEMDFDETVNGLIG